MNDFEMIRDLDDLHMQVLSVLNSIKKKTLRARREDAISRSVCEDVVTCLNDVDSKMFTTLNKLYEGMC